MFTARIHTEFEQPGFHAWTTAPAHRAYLRTLHRHTFIVRVTVGVQHDDREIELHDLNDWCREAFGKLGAPMGGMADTRDFGGLGCEHLARRLLGLLQVKYPGRPMAVVVDEEPGHGALVEG